MEEFILNYDEMYNRWLSIATDKDVLKELNDIKNNQDEINDRFYKELEFGTGGLRGVIGAGTNRMNVYTVGRATQGFSDYINSVKADAFTITKANNTYIIFFIFKSTPIIK